MTDEMTEKKATRMKQRHDKKDHSCGCYSFSPNHECLQAHAFLAGLKAGEKKEREKAGKLLEALRKISLDYDKKGYIECTTGSEAKEAIKEYEANV